MKLYFMGFVLSVAIGMGLVVLSIILDRRVDLGRANMVVAHRSDGVKTSVVAQDPELEAPENRAARDVAARLKRLDLGVDLVKEVARSCPLPINRDTTLEAQSWILHTQIADEIVAGSRGGYVLCDRSVIDNYAYLIAAAGTQPDLDA